MNEQQNLNKIKFSLRIGIISFMMGAMCFGILSPNINKVELLYTEVSNTGTAGSIKTGEIKTGQTSIKPNVTIKQDRRPDRSDEIKSSSTTKPTNTGTIRHTGFHADSIVQEYVNYSYMIGGENLVLLNECENGGRDLDLQSRVMQDYGRERSYGLCQLGLPRDGVDKERFLTDYKYQIETCWKYRSTGTHFYGPTRIIKGQYCYNYVRDRFIGLK